MSNEHVQNEMNRLIQQIKESQLSNGAWKYCFETGPMTDAYLLMVLRILEYEDEELIKKLYNRLINTQQANGSWKLYEDDEGNLSATVEAYTSLLYSGYVCPTDEKMKKAESFILTNGGIEKTHPSTKFMLALHDLYPWPSIFPLPLFLLNIPSFLPFHFYKFSSYVRAHLAPIMILGHKKFTIKNDWTPDLSHLFLNSKTGRPKKGGILSSLRSFSSTLFSKRTLKKTEIYMLRNIEEDGTLYSYASATFYMVYALLALGYRSNSPFILSAIQGLKSIYSRMVKNAIFKTHHQRYGIQHYSVMHYKNLVSQLKTPLLNLQQNTCGQSSTLEKGMELPCSRRVGIFRE